MQFHVILRLFSFVVMINVDKCNSGKGHLFSF